MALNRVSPEEAYRLMQDEGYVYLDVRSIPEFEQGHPQGAFNVPLRHMTAGGMHPNPDFLTVVENTFSKDTKIVVGCKSGGRSLQASEAMIAAGYAQIVDQRAGYAGTVDAAGHREEGWQPKGLPSSTQPEPGHSYTELAHKAHRG